MRLKVYFWFEVLPLVAVLWHRTKKLEKQRESWPFCKEENFKIILKNAKCASVSFEFQLKNILKVFKNQMRPEILFTVNTDHLHPISYHETSSRILRPERKWDSVSLYNPSKRRFTTLMDPLVCSWCLFKKTHSWCWPRPLSVTSQAAPAACTFKIRPRCCHSYFRVSGFWLKCISVTFFNSETRRRINLLH